MDIINKLFKDSNDKHKDLEESLKLRAARLHAEILHEVSDLRHDIYHKDFFNNASDPMVIQSKGIMSADLKARQKAGGPSIRRLKHHGAYWKHWHGEKTLLDRISIEKLEEIERLKSIKHAPTQSMLVARSRRERAAFTDANTNKSKLFDYHLLGDTSVKHILTHSKHVSVVPEEVLDPACNAVFPSTVPKARGGSFGRGPKASEASLPRLDTQKCDIPPLPSAFDSSSKGMAFPSASRFDHKPAQTTPATAPVQTIDTPSVTEGHCFSTAARFPGDSMQAVETGEGRGSQDSVLSAAEYLSATPGPGHYTLPRLFDAKPGERNKLSDLQAVFEKYSNAPHGLHDWAAQEICEMSQMGQSCNVEQHVLYGMCTDKHCLRRALFEKAAVAGNDRLRLGGYAARPAKLKGSHAAVLEAAEGLLSAPIYAMSALYAAAVFNDLATIARMGELGINPNTPQADTGYTPLHIAVIKKHNKAVYHLLHYFHNPAILQPADKHWLDINAADHAGNTSLHYASQLGAVDIVAMLCQEEDIDVALCNGYGQTALDMIGNHAVYSYIQLAAERNRLKNELAVVRKRQQLKQHAQHKH